MMNLTFDGPVAIPSQPGTGCNCQHETKDENKATRMVGIYFTLAIIVTILAGIYFFKRAFKA